MFRLTWKASRHCGFVVQRTLIVHVKLDSCNTILFSCYRCQQRCCGTTTGVQYSFRITCKALISVSSLIREFSYVSNSSKPMKDYSSCVWGVISFMIDYYNSGVRTLSTWFWNTCFFLSHVLNWSNFCLAHITDQIWVSRRFVHYLQEWAENL